MMGSFDHINLELWIPWISILIGSLVREESNLVFGILKRIAEKYPQALYYELRAFLIEKTQISLNPVTSSSPSYYSSSPSPPPSSSSASSPSPPLSSTTSSSSSPPPPLSSSTNTNTNLFNNNITNQNPSIQFAQELMSIMRNKNKQIFEDMEYMVSTMVTSFKPTFEESALNLVSQILAKFYDFIPLGSGDGHMPASLQSKLKLVSLLPSQMKSFSSSSSDHHHMQQQQQQQQQQNNNTASSSNDLSSNQQYSSVIKAFLDEFTDAKIEKMSLEIAMHKLRRWRNVLQNVLTRHMTPNTPLFKFSPKLASFHTSSSNCRSFQPMEVPGQYLTSALSNQMISPQNHVHLIRFGANVKISIGEKVTKRITLMGSNGKSKFWKIDNNENRVRDERMSHLTRVLNSLLLNHPQSRRRNVGIKQPLSIPITNTICLTEDNMQFTSLQNIYDEYCHDVGMEPDIAVLAYHRQLTIIEKKKAKNELENNKVIEEKVRGYREMCAKTPDSILANYIHSTLNADAEALWCLKRSIATRIATTSLLEHSFMIRQRSPQNVSFHRKTGAIISGNFRPSYNSFGALVVGFEEVPFRLTRNLTTLLSPLLVDGVFACSMGVTALALDTHRDTKLLSYLSLILRDDLVAATMISNSTNNMKRKSDLEQRDIEKAQEPMINRNVNTVTDLLHTAAPRALMDQSGERVLREHRVDHIVHRLIEAAAQPERLCMMNPSLMPWF
eukprot:CAMPEP_0114352786 /NCGR_PEP_ID=MMETSP0101-20121206/18188_1 /TAXON_ID=38822 ORGANISM="Pteridomonas danica, Strain PT" /NCGR_SAMPLE_ID=MMETSP0101 /ASSEMBLY_ACC=CAM_ASM_000211 /LENGTH=726 /DNA_ID=CAMNT_0001493323 /DNA_START=2470 /DNA_END=4650 /DNA_ORIENTATION=-